MTRSSFSNGAEIFLAADVAAKSQAPLRYSFSLEKEKSYRMEGLTVNLDADGKIWGAMYDTGEAVRHNQRYTMAKGLNGTLWFGDGTGMLHPLD